jgi:hypothetical protein
MGAFDDLPDAAPASGGAFADIPTKKKERFAGEPIAGALEPLLSMATGAIAKPASDIAGLASIPLHALGITQTDPTEVKNIVQQGMTYEPRTEMGQAMNLIPQTIGKGIDWAAKGVGNVANLIPNSMPNLQDAVRHGVEETVRQAPVLLGAAAPVVGRAISPAMETTASRLMQSALKPSPEEVLSGAFARGRDTMWNEGYNPSNAGIYKGLSTVRDLNNEVKDIIANSTATANKAEVGSTLNDALTKFRTQALPEQDMNTIQAAQAQFMRHPDLPTFTPEHAVASSILDESGQPFTRTVPASGTNEFPIQQAQALKQGTYKILGDRPYEQQRGAGAEAEVTLARGLKEAVAKGEPDVAPLNARESDILNAVDLMRNRVARAGNRNPVGIGVVTPTSARLAAWMVDRSDIAKSMLSRLLHSAANLGGESAAPVGSVMSQQADEAVRRKRLAQLLGSQ